VNKVSFAMTEDETVKWIKRMMWDHIRNGGNPKKITMSRKNFVELVSELSDLVCIDLGDDVGHMIFGMEVEIRDDVDPNTLFIIS